MAAVGVFTDVADDFVTCGICFEEYDEEIRTPKCLPCSHTVCVRCLQQIRQQNTITCPICRKCSSKDDSNESEWVLPTNSYALELLRVKRSMSNSFDKAPVPLPLNSSRIIPPLQEPSYPQQSTQQSVLRNPQSPKDSVPLPQNSRTIVSPLQIPSYLQQSIKKIFAKKMPKDAVPLPIAQVPSLPQQIIQQSLEKPAEEEDEQLKIALVMSSEAFKEEGHLNEAKAEKALNEAMIESLLLQQTIGRVTPSAPSVEPAEEEDEQLMIALAMSSETFKEEEPISSDPLGRCGHPIVLETSYPKKSIPQFPLNSSSKFILKIFQSGTPNGEIHFRPLGTFHPKFVQELGEFCYKSPQNFCCSISEAKSEEFVLLSVFHPHFQPAVPSMINQHRIEYMLRSGLTPIAKVTNQVGVTLIKNALGKVTGWSFLFFLNNCDDFGLVANLPDSKSEHFGDVISTDQNTLDALSQLSKVNNSERTCYNFTLESQ